MTPYCINWILNWNCACCCRVDILWQSNTKIWKHICFQSLFQHCMRPRVKRGHQSLQMYYIIYRAQCGPISLYTGIAVPLFSPSNLIYNWLWWQLVLTHLNFLSPSSYLCFELILNASVSITFWISALHISTRFKQNCFFWNWFLTRLPQMPRLYSLELDSASWGKGLLPYHTVKFFLHI